jgi:hypothetical protein
VSLSTDHQKERLIDCLVSRVSQHEKMATLEELRKEARKLESMLDVKLVSYSKFGANFAHSTLLREEDNSHNGASPWPEDVSNSMSLEIDQLLLKVFPPFNRLVTPTYAIIMLLS